MRAHLVTPFPRGAPRRRGCRLSSTRSCPHRARQGPAQRFASATEMALAIGRPCPRNTSRAACPAQPASRSPPTRCDAASRIGAPRHRRCPRARLGARASSRSRAGIALGARRRAVVLALIASNSGGSRSVPGARPSARSAAFGTSVKVARSVPRKSFVQGRSRSSGRRRRRRRSRASNLARIVHPSGRPPTPIGVGRLPSALAVDGRGACGSRTPVRTMCG